MAIVSMLSSPQNGAGVAMSDLMLNTLLFGILETADPDWIVISQGAAFDEFRGQFVFDLTTNRIASGVLTSFRELWGDVRQISITGLTADARTVSDLLLSGQADAGLATMLAGDDSFGGSNAADVIFGYGGNDLIGAGAGDDRVFGGAGADTIGGSSGADQLSGEAGDDRMGGDFGNDLLIGGPGSDQMGGGDGFDIAAYQGASFSYGLSLGPSGVWTVADNRPGSPEGTDFLGGDIERLRFSDGEISLVAAPNDLLAQAYANILRAGTGAGTRGAATVIDIAAGAASFSSAIDALVYTARATSSVATLAYQFFTGKVPSAAGMDYLVSPTGPNPNNINSAYYQAFNVENRYINFAVNLGKAGEGHAAFEAAYGDKTLAEATKAAYGAIFGAAPTDAKVAALLAGGRDGYFAYYGGDGPAGLGTKAAMVGWLLAEAAKADVGMYAHANDAFLSDLADGAAFAVDLVGVYGRPEYAFGG